MFGGARRDRTADLNTARVLLMYAIEEFVCATVALSQLSYSPMCSLHL